MSFIEPMFAAPMPTKNPIDLRSGQYIAEEKYDGHRLIVQVDRNHNVMAWSRNGLPRILPLHIINELKKFPPCLLDNELLVPGKRSYGVTDLSNSNDLRLITFDILEFHHEPLIEQTWEVRRSLNTKLFNLPDIENQNIIRLSKVTDIISAKVLSELCTEIWEHDGEGLIIKDRSSVYLPGKRPKTSWIKIKQLQSAVLTVVGFIPSKGKINNRGLYATIVIKDDEGNYTTVKTRNDEECVRLEKEAPQGNLTWEELRLPDKTKLKFHYGTNKNEEFSLGGQINATLHPRVGTKLRIEFQERTTAEFIRRHPEYALSSYRHPRMDRWENE